MGLTTGWKLNGVQKAFYHATFLKKSQLFKTLKARLPISNAIFFFWWMWTSK
jgi:hypothetical protein